MGICEKKKKSIILAHAKYLESYLVCGEGSLMLAIVIILAHISLTEIR